MSADSTIMDTPEQVVGLVERVREQGRMALDVEFLWERTYAPIPCLAQVAVGDEVALVDPIAGAPLDGVAALLADPAIEVVMHAPSADLTLFALGFDVRPSTLLDAQLIAGFVGMGAGQSLGALLGRVLDVKVAKTEGYSDWSRRPLTRAQLDYAAADVLYLFDLVDELMRRAEERGRTEWVLEEHERRYGPTARVAPDPFEAWRKVKGQGRLQPAERAVLRRAAAWRETEARRRDRPVGWLLPDRTLLEIARRRPSGPAAVLSERGVPSAMREREAQSLITAMDEAVGDPPIALGPPPPAKVQARLETLTPLAQILLTARSSAADLAPTLVATRDEVEQYLTALLMDRDPAGLSLGRGWRHDVAGSAIAELAAGRLGIAPLAASPYLAEIPLPDR
ncbi:MAG: HRDC domain-containing protein [Thermoleophilia bacterium]|nr:HRDC domain-containing protein [Thermoleophilia bacterium]